jgi:K+ transporter
VFLVTTGGEALYADLGHFGRQPIRRVWFAFVLPALLLKLAIGGAALALIEILSAKMRIFRAPEFLGSAFLFAVLAMLVHVLLGG